MRLPRRGVVLPDPGFREPVFVRPAQGLEVPFMALAKVSLGGVRRHGEEAEVHGWLLVSVESVSRSRDVRATGLPRPPPKSGRADRVRAGACPYSDGPPPASPGGAPDRPRHISAGAAAIETDRGNRPGGQSGSAGPQPESPHERRRHGNGGSNAVVPVVASNDEAQHQPSGRRSRIH